MIWYPNRGISVIFQIMKMRGSVFPRSAMASLVSVTIAFAVLTYKRGWLGTVPNDVVWMEHRLSSQVFFTLLGFCVVFRVYMALQRYEDGISSLFAMSGEWISSFALLVASSNASVAAGSDPEFLDVWRRELAHWFSLLSASAMRELRSDSIAADIRPVHYRSTQPVAVSARSRRKTLRFHRIKERWLYRSGSGISRKPLWPEDDGYFGFLWRWLERFRKSDYWPKHVCEFGPTDTTFEFFYSTTSSEEIALDVCSDRVLLITGWIQESITRILNSGEITTPPPIVGRTFESLSDGYEGYKVAQRVSRVPFPFLFAQMLSTLLVFFCVVAPFVVYNFTNNLIFTPGVTFVLVVAYWGLNEIACELELPFGDDVNDLPMIGIHNDFLTSLEGILASSKLLESDPAFFRYDARKETSKHSAK